MNCWSCRDSGWQSEGKRCQHCSAGWSKFRWWLHRKRGCKYNRAPLSRGPANRYHKECLVCGDPAPPDIQFLADLDRKHAEERRRRVRGN